ncbi:hypothetical protein H696_01014 [Fonticula alba]|uniref:Uncharacterized protein n=1 Tax=Fonticula alba TaxID=691883 RepID=A0A058ZGH9_FONAL|nr:hypothetical protein H696_01014 [Fonticula alba]KCV73475.1 hypothetical protein H696_01014 [Fonticula alba]|eukprot:XP_009493176.1 hypothetical protein H696_01014 [Fonticula alba]
MSRAARCSSPIPTEPRSPPARRRTIAMTPGRSTPAAAFQASWPSASSWLCLRCLPSKCQPGPCAGIMPSQRPSGASPSVASPFLGCNVDPPARPEPLRRTPSLGCLPCATGGPPFIRSASEAGRPPLHPSHEGGGRAARFFSRPADHAEEPILPEYKTAITLGWD